MKVTALKVLLALVICFSFSRSFTQQKPHIISKPIVYDETRIKLSLAYLKERYDITQTIPTITPTMIVLHWTGGNSLIGAFNTFNQATIQKSRTDIASISDLNVSAHYLVDRDGTIYQLMPDTLFARHTIGLNHCAIGIENIGSSNFPLTDKQLQANELLVRQLKSKYNISYLIGHYEYTNFKKTSLWKERDPRYETSKFDPGRNFMMKIRKNLADLKLKNSSSN